MFPQLYTLYINFAYILYTDPCLQGGRDGLMKSAKGMKMRGPGKMFTLVVVVLGLGIVLTLLNIYELHKMKEDHALHNLQPEGQTGVSAVRQPVVWVEGNRVSMIMSINKY